MSRNTWVALLLLATRAAGGADLPKELAAGDAALLRFDLPAAVAAYRQTHRLFPTNYEATWKLARGLADQATLTKDRPAQKKLIVEAESLAREAVRLNPRDAKGHVYLAIGVGKLALFEGGQRKVELSKEVKTEADRAVELNANEDIAWHVLGVWNREMAQLNWMLKKFAEFFYGTFPPASMDNALTDLRRASELAPGVIAHHAELGITLADARRWPEAKAELEKARTLPQAWVTDVYYRDLAKQNLDRVNRHQ